MNSARISLVGLYNYVGDDLFSLMELPLDVSRETLINNILLRSADFELTYPDADFMKNLIGLWSKKNYRTFDKWIKALSVEYNPLENYDRIEEWTDSSNVDTSQNGSKTNTGTVNIIDSNTSTSTGETINTVSAFDSSAFENDSKSDTSLIADNSGSNTRTDNLSETTKDDSNIKSNEEHHGRLHGNIGVTTSQQMLQSELDIAKWNIYEQITDLFVQEFCILIY